jgi:hypothetical protein
VSTNERRTFVSGRADQVRSESPTLHRHLEYCVGVPSLPVHINASPLRAKWIVAVHLSPAFEQAVLTVQPFPVGFTFRNSQVPPADETARRELMTMSGREPGSQFASDQEPTKVFSARMAEPDASSSSVLKSHLSSVPRLFAALNSRRAEREIESHLEGRSCKKPNSWRRDCTQRTFWASLRSIASCELSALADCCGAGGINSSGAPADCEGGKFLLPRFGALSTLGELITGAVVA